MRTSIQRRVMRCREQANSSLVTATGQWCMRCCSSQVSAGAAYGGIFQENTRNGMRRARGNHARSVRAGNRCAQRAARARHMHRVREERTNGLCERAVAR